MSVELKLTDYMPAIDDIASADLLDARDRIQTFLKTKEEFKLVDMRPNSVFGDLVLSPMAHILASFEVASNRMFSDIDLANVAAGTVYNCDFVKQYLNNFGQGQVYEYPSSGVIQISWASPSTKLIDVGTKFMFEADNGPNYIYELANVDNNITVLSPFEKKDPNNSNQVQLSRVSEDKFVANFAVKGPAGVGVNANTSAATDLGHADLTGVIALGDFDRGSLPENVMELANKVQKTYYSSTLNNRTGATSFLLQTFPELRGVSPAVSGDWEMLRDSENVLGVKEGNLDIHVKSRTHYLTTDQDIKMVYNEDEQRWKGSVTPLGPIVKVDSIRRKDSNQDSIITDIHGKSLNETRCPNLSSAYSEFEKLGFVLNELTTTGDSTPANYINGEENSITGPGGFTVTLFGQYYGNPFTNDYDKTFNLYFVEVFSDVEDGNKFKLRAELTDAVYADDGIELIFSQNTTSANKAYLESTDVWETNLNGITLLVEHPSLDFNSAASGLVGTNVVLNTIGRGATFSLRYRYDPNFSIINKILTDDDVSPVNTDVLLKSFLTCYVEELHVDYRKKEGQNVDLLKAKEEIVSYVNNLAYPYSYEEYTVAEILLFYGAEGVQRITQRGQYFRSLANKYDFNVDGTVTEVELENPYTTTLQPRNEHAGLGVRNVNYILDASRITFNAISI